MASLAEIDIIADRQVPYVEDFAFPNQDWTSSTFRCDVRVTRDTTGTPVGAFNSGFGLFLPYAGTATVAAHVTAGRLSGTGQGNIYTLTNPATGNLYQPSDSLTMSVFRFALNAFATSSSPLPEELGDDVVFYYDVIRTPPVGNDEIIMRGKFTVRAGVTIP